MKKKKKKEKREEVLWCRMQKSCHKLLHLHSVTAQQNISFSFSHISHPLSPTLCRFLPPSLSISLHLLEGHFTFPDWNEVQRKLHKVMPSVSQQGMGHPFSVFCWLHFPFSNLRSNLHCPSLSSHSHFLYKLWQQTLFTFLGKSKEGVQNLHYSVQFLEEFLLLKIKATFKN